MTKRLDNFFNLLRPSNEDEDVTMDESPEQDDIADPNQNIEEEIEIFVSQVVDKIVSQPSRLSFMD